MGRFLKSSYPSVSQRVQRKGGDRGPKVSKNRLLMEASYLQHALIGRLRLAMWRILFSKIHRTRGQLRSSPQKTWLSLRPFATAALDCWVHRLRLFTSIRRSRILHLFLQPQAHRSLFLANYDFHSAQSLSSYPHWRPIPRCQFRSKRTG